jgi:hypothetical protein
MLKRINCFGTIVIVSLVAALWALTTIDGMTALRNEPDTKGSATMTNNQSTKSTVQEKKPVKESPFACNMLALDAEGRRRHKTVTEQMRAVTKEVQALKDGYAFRFPADQSTILLISEFIARERLCCPFLTFELVAEQEEGPLWLRLRGREGVKEFIKAELGIK